MGLSRRVLVIVTSVLLLFVVAISLVAAIEVRSSPRKIIPILQVQAQQAGKSDRESVKGKAKINGSDFDRADIYPAPTVYLTAEPTPVPTTPLMTTSIFWSSINDEDGMIGRSKTAPLPSTSVVGKPSSRVKSSLPSAPTGLPGASPPPTNPQLPIVAMTYTGSSGPQHCRGELIARVDFPLPPSAYKNGTCINLPAMARCGVFFAYKEAGCEADLFNADDCLKTTTTYVNTVVFMPEERSVGAYWKSMKIRCGVEAPEAKLLDPALLEGLVKNPTAKTGTP
ncbi:uncharacterized protein EI97DRAFT_184761 [Westerdykella ornata]|uniref:Uncharacterized protein n=1 Tax=Westerdykella ornata TaxID=318751 RepID=A0A6A6JTZ6_WESOR|nr:uncharacterized protein EI97DRAFT_184761 [Westerdykella ornata]KAF2279715.1 hypothetical protein EI97DRAFT_184761 [Westerdykella ornata]